VRISPNADNARNFSQCDSYWEQLWCAYFPYIESKIHRLSEHEATTSKIGEDQVFYCNNVESLPKKIALIVNGFSKDVLNNYQWNLL
jgi:Fe-S cluster assembly protein SufB